MAQLQPRGHDRGGMSEITPLMPGSDYRRTSRSWHGSIGSMSSPSDAEQRRRARARLGRVGDRMDREYAQPLDVEALARDAHMSAGHLSRQFRMAYGES